MLVRGVMGLVCRFNFVSREIVFVSVLVLIYLLSLMLRQSSFVSCVYCIYAFIFC